MARPRSFDEEAVVDAAAACFRRLGYAATSVDDLVSATGLHRGSLYGAFGSKRGLFVTALERSAAAPRAAHLDLLLVAALELAPHDEGLRRAVAGACAQLAVDDADAASVLGRRLLERAGLARPSADPDDATTPTDTTTSTTTTGTTTSRRT